VTTDGLGVELDAVTKDRDHGAIEGAPNKMVIVEEDAHNNAETGQSRRHQGWWNTVGSARSNDIGLKSSGIGGQGRGGETEHGWGGEDTERPRGGVLRGVMKGRGCRHHKPQRVRARGAATAMADPAGKTRLRPSRIGGDA
jgi:hypothetical protein